MRFPFFNFGCNLEINDRRTATYLSNASLVCAAGDIKSLIDFKCECQPLHWVFGANDLPLPGSYTTPAADQAPWYDASIPESGQFFGFIVEDVVMNVVASRTVRSRTSASGGGVIGPVRNRERKLDFTVLMFGCNELAMEYGFRYLNDALNSPGCDDGCTLCDAEFRDSCPNVDGSLVSLNKGRWILKNCAAVEGPRLETPPLEGSQCNMRRVTFSIASEFPYKFKCPVVQCNAVALAGFPAPGVNCDNWSNILCGTNEVQCSVSEPLIIGETGMIIEVAAGSVPLQHIQIAVRPDKFGYECNVSSRPAGYTRVEPCDLIYVPEIPANSTLIYDTSIESIVVRVAGGGEYEGTPFIATAEGRPPTYPTLRCGDFCVSISVSECSVIGSPTVTVRSVHREI